MSTANKGKTVPPGLKPFKPGQSGNPKGRPKIAEDFRAGCKRILDAKVLRRWEQEIEEDGPEWFRASELIAAYAVGKPTQKVEVKDLDGLTDEQLEARYQALIAKGAATATQPPHAGPLATSATKPPESGS